MHEIELLAPVGSWEALEAAVQNGADAVYLGGKAFSARQHANNFDHEELIKAVQYCHIRDVKVFITVNTLVTNEELKDLAKYIAFLYNIDVDALIIQDLGMAKLVKDLLPDFELHASTQMSVHNAEGVKMLEELGFKRAVLAREMSIDEIKHVKEQSSLDLEVFVHGALCVCYSGQCLMSSMIGGRSGNRGRCAQPCRMTYTLVNQDTGKEIKNTHGDYILSPRDLNTLQNIDKVLKTGVKSLKIEGRMKRPEYVAIVVRAYRDAIDQYKIHKEVPNISQETLHDVEQIFNRRFTKGYILGEKGKEIMSFSKPSNRGIKIGKVIFYDNRKRKIGIQLEGLLRKGDGIEVWSEKGDNPGTIVENIFFEGNKKEQALPGSLVEVPFKHQAAKGSPVYKTSDVELLRRARETYERKDKSIEIVGEFRGEIGHEIELALWDDHNHCIHAKGSYIVQKAQKVAIEKDRIKEQISKLGDTPYKLQHFQVHLDEDASIPIGELNQLRRAAVEQLNSIRGIHNNRLPVNIQEFSKQLDSWFNKSQNSRSSFSISVSVASISQLKTVLKFKIDRVYYCDMNSLEQAEALIRPYSVKFVPVINRVIKDEKFNILRDRIKELNRIDGIMVGDLGALFFFRKMKLPVFADFSLNIFNTFAIRLLNELGVKGVTLSPELNLKQMSTILQNSAAACEAIVHGHLPLMVTKYCPLSTVINKDNKQDSCNLCRNTQFGLKDRLGLVFPIYTGNNCSIQILNAQKMCLLEHIKELEEAFITNIRIDFTIEKEDEITQTLSAYLEAVESVTSGSSRSEILNDSLIEKIKGAGFTKGHFFRGVK